MDSPDSVPIRPAEPLGSKSLVGRLDVLLLRDANQPGTS